MRLQHLNGGFGIDRLERLPDGLLRFQAQYPQALPLDVERIEFPVEQLNPAVRVRLQTC